MAEYRSKIFFDKQDHEILVMVNDILNRDRTHKNLKNLLNPYLHPRGIKELATYRELRIAYATIHLLDTLDVGTSASRLSALRSLRDETLHTSTNQMRMNTARVLLQVMKELLRAHGDYQKQLELAHDFRIAFTGKLRAVRALLSRYHLLEMPEEWNQLTFDSHVHDSNTKGRKTPTHLITDAWIKGIRYLTVIYYNNVEPEAITELLEAARIMDISVEIGIEFPARFGNKFAYLIWTPRGITDTKGFLSLLENKRVEEFMRDGQDVNDYQARFVVAVFEKFNRTHRLDLNKTYGINVPALDYGEFIEFVGSGQVSTMHMADFFHSRMMVEMKTAVEKLQVRYATASPKEKAEIEKMVAEMNSVEPRMLVDKYLRPSVNRDIPDPNVPHDNPDTPVMLKMSPAALVGHLEKLPCTCRLTLNLSNLTVEDIIELLFDCEGKITHLEIFNLKDYISKKSPDYVQIEKLRCIINEGNIVKIKQIIRQFIKKMESSGDPGQELRCEKFRSFLHKIEDLRMWYKDTPLKARMGSDSAGRMRHTYGMGLAVKETLPWKARRQIDHASVSQHLIVPFGVSIIKRTTTSPQPKVGANSRFIEIVRRLPGFGRFKYNTVTSWHFEYTASSGNNGGSIVTLGGIREEKGNGLSLKQPEDTRARQKPTTKYLNTGIRNELKVLIGFIPAFFTFLLTKEWFFLKYFGAFIWFGITGFRNIIQSILAGRGLKHYTLLKWSDFVQWERVADSLLYTGFSVPLLDFLVKTLLLDRMFGINTSNNPIALYAIMALVNGVYISSHNVFRGLPKEAAIGNFFRSILSIPLAIFFNSAFGGILAFAGVPGINNILQKWAAIISKLASDCVAAVIEGTADRKNNIKARVIEHNDKLGEIFDTYSRIELLFPEKDVLKMLESPKEFLINVKNAEKDIEKITIINALDMLYFWMYLPRARITLESLMGEMTECERRIITRSMVVLLRNKEVSQLFIDGMIGKNFSRALAFYLDNYESFIADMKTLEKKFESAQVK